MLEQTPAISRRPSPLRYILLGIILGLLLGAGVASVVWFAILWRERVAFAEALGVHGLAGDLLHGAGQVANFPPPDNVLLTDVKSLGDSFVDDLSHNRVLAAYRLTTPEYQLATPRKDFEDMVRKYPEISQWQRIGLGDVRTRKGAAANRNEYYSTMSYQDGGLQKRVNFALTMSQQGGAWKINEVEIVSDERK